MERNKSQTILRTKLLNGRGHVEPNRNRQNVLSKIAHDEPSRKMLAGLSSKLRATMRQRKPAARLVHRTIPLLGSVNKRLERTNRIEFELLSNKNKRGKFSKTMLEELNSRTQKTTRHVTAVESRECKTFHLPSNANKLLEKPSKILPAKHNKQVLVGLSKTKHVALNRMPHGRLSRNETSKIGLVSKLPNNGLDNSRLKTTRFESHSRTWLAEHNSNRQTVLDKTKHEKLNKRTRGKLSKTMHVAPNRQRHANLSRIKQDELSNVLNRIALVSRPLNVLDNSNRNVTLPNELSSNRNVTQPDVLRRTSKSRSRVGRAGLEIDRQRKNERLLQLRVAGKITC